MRRVIAVLLLLPSAAAAQDPHLNDAVDAMAATGVEISKKLDGMQAMMMWEMGILVVFLIAVMATFWAGRR